MSRTLAVHSWGAEGSPRVVCLHGVTSQGRHFTQLAEGLAPRFHVQALVLLGHGDSPWEPPWNVRAQVEAVLATAERVADVRGRLLAAENGRPDRSYASFEEGIDRRYEESRLQSAPRELLERELAVHLVPSDDGRWRYRYCQSAVVAAYGEMSDDPPGFEQVEAPTLVLLGDHSYLPYDHLLEDHRAALGDRLGVLRLDAGHTLLWDAADETIDAVERFLELRGD